MATAADTVKTASDKMKSTVEQYATAVNQAFKDNVEKGLAALNDMNAHSKKNLEAMVASTTAATKGAEALGAQFMAYGKAALDHHVAATKALTSARSVQEAIELQTTYAKSALESYIAEMNKATETVSTTMKDAVRPLNERATATVEAIQAAR